MQMSYYMIMSFYVVVIGLCMMAGAYIARSIRVIKESAGEASGVVVGGLVGLYVSMYMWKHYGRKMVQQA